MSREEAGNLTKRQSHVSTEMNELMKSIDFLEETLGRTRQRFASVVYVPPPSEKAKIARDDQQLIPLAENIRDVRYRIRTAANDLQDLIDNCEL